jgi:hypothetical protein
LAVARGVCGASAHVADDARQQLSKKVVAHLELSGFEIDEERQVMTKRRPAHGHG